MRLLLDTHVLLHVLDPTSKILSARQVQKFEAIDACFFVSVISLWEISIKWRLNKLALPVDPIHIPELVHDFGFTVLQLTADESVSAPNPMPQTRDPFDQMLLAQCAVGDFKLLTIDRALSKHPSSAQIW